MTDSTFTQIKHERDRNHASALYHKRKRVAAETREAALLDRLAALEARLEVVPGWSEDADGIACRNATIKMQDERLAALEAKALDYIRDGRGDDSEAVLLAAAHRELGERRADAAVVGWLRGPFVPDHSDEGGCPFDKAAKMLERSDHRSKP